MVWPEGRNGVSQCQQTEDCCEGKHNYSVIEQWNNFVKVCNHNALVKKLTWLLKVLTRCVKVVTLSDVGFQH